MPLLAFFEFNTLDLSRFFSKTLNIVQAFAEVVVVLINGFLFFSERFEFFNHLVVAFKNYVSVVFHFVINNLLNAGQEYFLTVFVKRFDQRGFSDGFIACHNVLKYSRVFHRCQAPGILH